MLKRNDANYGKGKTIVVSDDDIESDEARQKNQLAHRTAMLVRQTIDSDQYQPPLLPEVAVSLSEMAGKPNVSIRDVEALVTRDPTVAARVVAVANSAFYNRGTSIKSLRAAITRLGLSEVRDVAFQVVAKTRIFRVPGYTERMRELFDAAQAAGLVTRKLCRILRFESELAYLCGLLHDMGEAIILGIIGDNCRENKTTPPSLKALDDAIVTYHSAAGARVCSLWGLSETIADAVRCHHSPDRSENPSQMATVVAVADICLAHAGIGCETKRVDPLQEPLFYRLNLNPEQVEELLSFADAVGENEDSLS